MSDRRPLRTAPPRFNSVVASATTMTASTPALRQSTKGQAWQEDAWRFYDTNGELRFAVGWIANGLSRLNMLAAKQPDVLGDNPSPVEGASDIENAANALVADIAGGPDGQSELLNRLATLLTVPGLGWVLIESPDTPNIDGTWSWRALSNEELRSDRGEYEVRDVESDDANPDGWRSLDSQHVLIKIWRSHPRDSSLPDSSCRGALRPLRQLSLLDDHIEATAQSRLAGAGMLVLPNEVEFAPIATADDEDEEVSTATTDDFVEVLIDTMTTPIVDRGSAAAVVPLTVKVPGEYVDKVKYLTFWSEFSDTVLELGERAIKRLALALDMPPEIVTGVSGMNHWGAWRVQEEAITLHIEPLALIICDALTKNYLRPALFALGFEQTEISQLLIATDATNLTVRPDKSDDTIAAWDRLEASSATLRREIGLSEADKPDDAEKRERLILRAIDRSPQLAAALLPTLGIDIAPIENDQQYPTEPTETNGDDSADGGPPSRERPNQAAERPPLAASARPDSRLSSPALVAACDGLVHRALERAGARLRNKAGSLDRAGAAAVECDDISQLHTRLDVSSFGPIHELLNGAWDRVPSIADRYDVPSEALLAAVDSYTRALLINGQAHDIDQLQTVMPRRMAVA